MTDLRPLAVYPWPVTPADRALIHTALDTIAPPYNVTIVEAVPGGPTPVLALRGLPPFFCDAAILLSIDNPSSMVTALTRVLDPNTSIDLFYNVHDYLEQIFGQPLRELIA